METDTLKKAFDAASFRKTGISLIEHLADIFEEAGEQNVIPYRTPDEQYQYWKEDFNEKGEPLALFKEVISRSTLYHHPGYMGHQTAVPALTSTLASLVVDFVSNGMGVYEVGMVGNTMERVVTEHLCRKFNLGENAGGFVTSGGTLGTLTAMLTAKAHFLNSRTADRTDENMLSIITSEQAHYCVERAALTMGITPDRIIKLPVDESFQMRTDLLEEEYQKALVEGKQVFCVIASAPSTSTGAYDNLSETARFCKKYAIWFHADGAHGASVIFSKKYKHLIQGIEHADSIVMDFHKTMLTPSVSTAVLLKNRAYAYDTFRQKADYLWQKQDFEWYHGGKSTFECTKSMSILKTYVLFKQSGDKIFEEFIDYQYDLTKEFARQVEEAPDFEAAHQPDSNILCFRFTDCDTPNELNMLIREELIKEGHFYIVQTTINDTLYLRVTLLNPRTTKETISALLTCIRNIATRIKNNP